MAKRTQRKPNPLEMLEEWHITPGADHEGPIGPDPDMPPGAVWGDGPPSTRPKVGRRQAKARNRIDFELGRYDDVARQTPSAVDRMRGKMGTGGMVGMGAGALGAVGLLGQLLSSGDSMPETGGIGFEDPGVGDGDLDDMNSMVNMMRAQAGSPRFAAGDPEMRAFIESEWDRVAQASMPARKSLRQAMAERGYF